MEHTWLTPKAQVRPAGGKGLGSFAIAPIAAGETVAAFGGWVTDRAGLATVDDARMARTFQIDDELYLVPSHEVEPGDVINHSCDPTCGVRGAILIAAMRDIEVGEELTFDYAMSDGSDYDEFACLCEAATCRGTISGSDWRDPKLQERYAGWFSPYLATRIARLSD